MNILLPFPSLVEAIFIKKVNRFIAEVEITGLGLQSNDAAKTTVQVHLPTTGRLDTVLESGQHCYLMPSDNPKRKTPYTLFLVKTTSSISSDESTLVCIDALYANRIAHVLLTKQMVTGISSETVRSEVTFGKDRLDFVTYDSNDESGLGVSHLVEVKSVTMCVNGVACFPDAPTERGQKHLQTLLNKQHSSNLQTHVLFIVLRNDATTFSPCKDRDPKFAQFLKEAHENGTQIHACLTDITPAGISILKWLPISL